MGGAGAGDDDDVTGAGKGESTLRADLGDDVVV